MKEKGIFQNKKAFNPLVLLKLAVILFIGAVLLSSCEAAEDEGTLNYDCDNLCHKIEQCGNDNPALRVRFYDQFDDIGDCRGECKKGDNWTVECMLDCDTELLTCNEYFDCLEDCLGL